MMQPVDYNRVLVWFSCGAASAVAAKLAVQEYDNVEVCYCDTLAEEHDDNQRFMRDVEEWIGHSITMLKSDKYENVEDVWDKRSYMAGIAGAPCTVEMKKVPRLQYQRPDDLHIFGLTADEQRRIETFARNNHDIQLAWPLLEHGITKKVCYEMLYDAGIRLPKMYELGFNNNNCIGCVKATSPKYWARVAKHFPEVFERRARQSREIGAKLVRVDNQRIYLDEMPFDRDWLNEGTQEEDVSCGPDCGTTDMFKPGV